MMARKIGRALAKAKSQPGALPSMLVNLLMVGSILWAAVLIFHHLSSLPGLHADEAAFGIEAIKIVHSDQITIHGMNSYTGSLFQWLVSLMFRLQGTSVFALRSVGAVANLVALILLAWSVKIYRGTTSLAILLLLILSSPFIFIYSRVAWEVAALQFLFVVAITMILLQAVHDRRLTNWQGLMFLSISTLGAFNHFIFLTNTIGFSLASVALYLSHRPESEARGFFARLVHLSLITLAVMLVMVTVKPKMGDWMFAAEPVRITLLFIALVLGLFDSFICHDSTKVCILLFDKPLAIMTRLARRSSSNSKRWTLSRLRTVLVIAVLTLLALVIAHQTGLFQLYHKHLWGLIGSVSSLLPLQRIFSYKPVTIVNILSHLFWTISILLFLTSMLIGWLRLRRKQVQDNYDLIFYLYPALTFAILPFMIRSSSERYYLISCYLLISAIPIVWDRIWTDVLKPFANKLGTQWLWGLLLLSLANISAAQASLYDATFIHPGTDAPFLVSYIDYQDTSYHFADSSKLSAYLNDMGVCYNLDANYFIKAPVTFYQLSHGSPCQSRAAAHVDYCENCSSPVKNFAITLKSSTIKP